MFIPPYIPKRHDDEGAKNNDDGGGGVIYPFLQKQKTKLGDGGEMSKLAENIKPLKVQETNKTDVGYFDPKKYKIVDPALALLGRKEYVTKSLKSGRIRFENMLVPAEASRELICEECEKVYAILRCDACEQVMCDLCADICHPRTHMGTKLHNHEVRNKIRPLNAKDVSKVYKFEGFSLPACDVFEEDYMLLRDITKPGVLIGANSSTTKSSQMHTLPRFHARDKVVFKDPETGKDSYGKIISDWDFGHGEKAPSITRGYIEKNKSGNFYIVQFLGNIDAVQNIDIILKLDVAPPPPKEYPILEGLKPRPYAEEYKLAGKFNTGIDLNAMKAPKGPVRHLISQNDEDDMTQRGDYYFLLPKIEQYAKPRVDVAKGLTGNEEKTQEGSWAQAQTFDRALGYSEVYAYEHPNYYQDPEYIRKAMGILILPECELVRPEEKLEVLEKAKFAAIDNLLEKILFKLTFRLMAQGFLRWKGRMDALKEFRIYFSARKIQANFRRMRCWDVLAMKRADYAIEKVKRIKKFHEQFHYCSENTPYSKTMDSKIYFRTTTYANRYYYLLRKSIMKIVKQTNNKRLFMIRESMARWRLYLTNMQNQITKIGHFDMHTIDIDDFEAEDQARAEYNSNMIKMHQILKNKGAAKVPEGFDDLSYNNITTLPLAVTREFGTVRKELLEKTSRLSSTSPTNINSNGNCNSNSNAETDSRPNSPDNKLSSPGSPPGPGGGSSRPGTKESTRPSTSTSDKPSSSGGLRRKKKEKVNENIPVNIPPYHPRVGIKDLPALKAIVSMKTAEERLSVMRDRNKRISYCSYKAYHEGPTPDSCWIIPGKLLIGKCPYKRMFKNSDVIQLSGVMGVGVSHVISLMTDDEEYDMGKDLGINSIESSMASALFSTKAAKGRAILESEAVVLEQKEILSKIPKFHKSDPRYEQSYREKLRCNARIKMAETVINKQKDALKLVPTSCEWSRIPLEHDDVPTMHELMTHLWDIEDKLAQGAVIFMYSKEGHGRVGMMGACLLGRLYGLTPLEAFFRVQNSHDSQECESEKLRPVVIQCPQLTIQRKLVEDVLSHTNRIYDGIIHRSQNDPETYNEELHLIRRGGDKGLDAPTMYTQVVANVVRSKTSVRFGIDLPRDVKMAPKLRHDKEYEALEDSKASLDEMFAKELQTQLANIVRDPPEEFYGSEDKGEYHPIKDIVTGQEHVVHNRHHHERIKKRAEDVLGFVEKPYPFQSTKFFPDDSERRRSSALAPKLPLIRAIQDVKPQGPL